MSCPFKVAHAHDMQYISIFFITKTITFVHQMTDNLTHAFF